MRLISLLALMVCLFLSSCKNNALVQDRRSFAGAHAILQNLPGENRQILDAFFELLLRDYDFAYTLFGEKPMSIAGYSSQITSFTLYHPGECLAIQKGWERWRYYSSHFPSDTFVLKQCHEARNISEIFIINKKNALKAIENNLFLFREVLGDQVEPQALLSQLCSQGTNICEILNNHSGLLGILLGYGKNNSMFFERKINICEALNTKMTPPLSAIQEMKSLQPEGRHLVKGYRNNSFSSLEKGCVPSSSYSSLTEELNAILDNEGGFELYGSNFFLDKLNGPVFMARNGDLEAKQLQREYLAAREKIRVAYQQEPLLEATLNQWMSPQ